MTSQVGMDQLLSSFASASEPSMPTAGQLWYDTSASVLKVYTGAGWIVTGSGSTTISNTPPALPENGDLWYDSGTNYRLYIWSSASTAWVDASPAGAGGGGSSSGPNVQVFGGSGTFAVPSGVTSVRVTLFGGGGGGSGVGSTLAYGGSGGYGIAYITGLTPGAAIAVTVGNGGNGGNVTLNGSAGGTTSFGSYASATGGGGSIVTGENEATAGAQGSFTTTGTALTKVVPEAQNLYLGGARGTPGNGGTNTSGGGGMSGGGAGWGATIIGAGGRAYGPGANGTNGAVPYVSGDGGSIGTATGGTNGAYQGGGGGGAGGVIVEW